MQQPQSKRRKLETSASVADAPSSQSAKLTVADTNRKNGDTMDVLPQDVWLHLLDMMDIEGLRAFTATNKAHEMWRHCNNVIDDLYWRRTRFVLTIKGAVFHTPRSIDGLHRFLVQFLKIAVVRRPLGVTCDQAKTSCLDESAVLNDMIDKETDGQRRLWKLQTLQQVEYMADHVRRIVKVCRDDGLIEPVDPEPGWVKNAKSTMRNKDAQQTRSNAVLAIGFGAVATMVFGAWQFVRMLLL